MIRHEATLKFAALPLGKATPSGHWRLANALVCCVVSASCLVFGSGCPQTETGIGEVGTATCLACHDGRSATDKREFQDSPHNSISCETCHGGGLAHVREGGRLGLFIQNPDRMPFAERHQACVECHGDVLAHGGNASGNFLVSAHFAAGAATCTDCHDVHKMGGMVLSSRSPARFGNANYSQFCGSCHEGAVHEFALSTHAQLDVATCSSCHDMHAGDMFRASPVNNQLCIQCHGSSALGFDTDADIDFHTGPFHPVDPAGSGASRCTGCHLPPVLDSDGAVAGYDHTLFTIAPESTNDALRAGVTPAPPNSCAGVMGCHDVGAPGSGTPHDPSDMESNANLQLLYEALGAQPRRLES